MVAGDGEGDAGDGGVERKSQSVEGTGARSGESRDIASGFASGFKDDLGERNFRADLDFLARISAKRVAEEGSVSDGLGGSSFPDDEGEGAVVPDGFVSVFGNEGASALGTSGCALCGVTCVALS